MKKTPKQPAPRHLSLEARALWARLHASFVLDDPGSHAMLRLACEAFDRAERARQLIDRDGECLKDRFGQVRVHPACAVERDARAQMLMALKALRLDPGAIEGDAL
jgi:P27 family predicted phage terminase small subunit